MGESSDKRKLFQKFLNNDCTEAELEQVMAYLNAAEVPAELEVLMQENLTQKIAAQPKVSPEVSARLFRHIQANIAKNQSGVRKLPLQRMQMFMAAAVSLVLLAGLVYFYMSTLRSPGQVYATTYGETRDIILPDGSHVVLNANSKLTVPADWSAALQQNKVFVREVWLEGEGIFEVKKLADPARFVVHTEALKVEVLGTTFNVNSRAQKTRVVLDEGKVKLLARNQTALIMNPGEMVELAKDDIRFQKKRVNPANYMAWRHDELVFEATPITEILDMLENTYGYKVVVRQKAVTQDMLFTGKVPADDTELLLKMLSASFNIRVSQKDNTIIFQQ